MPRRVPVYRQEAPTRLRDQAITASSRVYGAGAQAEKLRKTGQRSRDRQWQQEIWDFYDMVPEFRFGCDWVGNLISRAKLYVVGPDGKPTDNQHARNALQSLFNGPEGQEEMLRLLGVNFTVAGEAWVIGDDSSGVDEWRVAAATEVYEEGRQLKVEGDVLPESAHGIRLWKAHPRISTEANSPSRAVMPILGQIVQLSMVISAQAESRLSGNGILFIPQEIELPAIPATSSNDGDGDMTSMQNLDAAASVTRRLIEIAKIAKSDPETAAAQIPLILAAEGQYLEKIQHIDLWSKFDETVREIIASLIDRLAIGMDMPPEVIKGTGEMNHWGCVDTETEILTDRGWLHLEELREGECILTLNHETGLSEWQNIRGMNRYEVSDIPMLRMQGRGHDSLTTLNHRWPVLNSGHDRREFTTSEKLNTAHSIPTGAPSADLPTDMTYSDAFVELVAWYWTEGWRSNPSQMKAAIAQSHARNPERVLAIRSALAGEYGDNWGSEHVRTTKTGYGDPVTSFSLRHAVIQDLDAVAPGKIVSLEFIRSLTRAQLELFIQTSCAGDGWHYRQGKLDIWQKNKDALAAYELALILSGRMVAWSEHAGGYVVNGYTSKTTVQPIKAGMDSLEVYSGTVWCPTVQNGTWLARRNGTVWFTGNSWQVEEAAIKAHTEPLLGIITASLTTGYLVPYLEAMGVQDAVLYSFEADTSKLRLRPNRSKEALELYDRGALNRETLLIENGFDPEVALMDEKEYQQWLLQKIASGSTTPDQVAMAARLLGVVGLPGTVEQQQITQEARPTRSLEEHPTRSMPDEEDSTIAASAGAPFVVDGLVLAAEQMVYRALERAGNKLKARMASRSIECEAAELYLSVSSISTKDADALLQDGWAAVDRFDYPVDKEKLRSALNEFTFMLLCMQKPYRREALARHLLLEMSDGD